EGAEALHEDDAQQAEDEGNRDDEAGAHEPQRRLTAGGQAGAPRGAGAGAGMSSGFAHEKRSGTSKGHGGAAQEETWQSGKVAECQSDEHRNEEGAAARFGVLLSTLLTLPLCHFATLPLLLHSQRCAAPPEALPHDLRGGVD